MQQYLQDRYGIESKFIRHSFYPYPILRGDSDDTGEENKKTHAVSISRIDFNKNIDIILDANKRVIKITPSKYMARRMANTY